MSEKANAEIELRMDRELGHKLHAAIFEGVREVFELDIKPEAVRLSPVDTGLNRKSIDTEVVLDDATGAIEAKLFTQSGYGGYLELGHKVRVKSVEGGGSLWRGVQGRPYLYPAFMKFRRALATACGRHITEIRTTVQKVTE